MRKLVVLFLLLACAGIAVAQSVGWPPPAGMQMALGTYKSSAPTLTDGQVSPLQLDVNGKLITSGSGGAVTVADGADVAQGSTTDAACAGDNTSGCTIEARLQRIAQRLTSVITTLGSPAQAGASFGATIADGGDVTQGALADAVVAAGAAGSVSAKLRTLTAIGANPFTYSAQNLTSTLTLPSQTTAYTAGNLICTSATVATCNTGLASAFFTIANSAGAVAISRIRLTTNDATSTAWGAQTIQIDLWSAAPTFATTGDRGAFTTNFLTGSAGHLATFNCTMSAELADGAYSECAPSVGSYALIKLGSGTSIFYTLNAITGSGTTGASKVFTLTAEVVN